MEWIPKCLHTPEFRAEAVKLVMGSGLSVDAAAKRLSVPKNSLGNWVRASRNGKLAKVGEGLRLPTDAEVELARLNAEQEEAIRRTICDKRPEQLKMEFALWTRGEVLLFIEQEYGVKLSIRAVGDYLKRWGFTPTSACITASPSRYGLPNTSPTSKSFTCPATARNSIRTSGSTPTSNMPSAHEYPSERRPICTP